MTNSEAIKDASDSDSDNDAIVGDLRNNESERLVTCKCVTLFVNHCIFI